MKKKTILLLALMAALCLSACGEKEPGEEEAFPPEEEAVLDPEGMEPDGSPYEGLIRSSLDAINTKEETVPEKEPEEEPTADVTAITVPILIPVHKENMDCLYMKIDHPDWMDAGWVWAKDKRPDWLSYKSMEVSIWNKDIALTTVNDHIIGLYINVPGEPLEIRYVTDSYGLSAKAAKGEDMGGGVSFYKETGDYSVNAEFILDDRTEVLACMEYSRGYDAASGEALADMIRESVSFYRKTEDGFVSLQTGNTEDTGDYVDAFSFMKNLLCENLHVTINDSLTVTGFSAEHLILSGDDHVKGLLIGNDFGTKEQDEPDYVEDGISYTLTKNREILAGRGNSVEYTIITDFPLNNSQDTNVENIKYAASLIG